ncbi:hypothetical protein HYV74_01690 [Candidatus Uhrbacteria bacterium]|nr:hypothetical protein [Candidatus Uhrbacteria bacterium]
MQQAETVRAETAAVRVDATPRQEFFSVGRPVVRARNLIASVMSATKQKLFGAATPFDPASFRECVAIPGGDVRAYLAQRLEQSDLTVNIPSVPMIDTAIIAMARQIAHPPERLHTLNGRKLERIALEYLIAGCYLPPAAIVPFERYLDISLAFRDAAKQLNHAARVSTEDAFVRGASTNFAPLMRLNTGADDAWKTITTLLTTDAHLATLRTRFLAPFIYPNWSTWQELARMESARRLAICSELCVLLTEERTPFVTNERFVRAVSLVDGNQLLVGGNPFGVTRETCMESVRHARMPGMQRADATQIEFHGVPAGSVGGTIAGLRGGIDGSMRLVDGGRIQFTLALTEGLPKSAPCVVPIDVHVPGHAWNATLYCS